MFLPRNAWIRFNIRARLALTFILVCVLRLCSVFEAFMKARAVLGGEWIQLELVNGGSTGERVHVYTCSGG